MDSEQRMTKSVTVLLIVCTAFLFIMTVFTQEAGAIPAFARKYQTSCMTCHSAFPRLNAVGEAYRLNGFRFEDEDLYIKEEPIELGDEAYKKVWPNAVWPSDISGTTPISVRVLSDFTMDIGGTKKSRSNFTFPDEIEVLAGGTMGDNLSYFAEIEFEGGESITGAWFGFDDLFGPENLFNVRVGNLHNRAGLFTARDGNRLTKEHYLYGNWRFPYPSSFDTKNESRIRDVPAGVELNGFGSRWFYSVGVGEGDRDVSEKNVFAHLAWKFGGLGFDGSGTAETGETLGSAESWRDDSLTVSVFANSGRALVNDTGAAADERTDDFWRAGPGLLWKHKDIELGGGYFIGENDNPYGALSSKSVDSRGWFVEVAYFMYPWLTPSVRFETLDLDLPSGVSGLQKEQDQARIVASVKALLRANVSLIVEGRFSTTDDRSVESSTGELDDDNQLAMRLDFSF